MKKLLPLLLILFSMGICAQEKIEEIEQFEIRSYAPQKSGVTDLVFEARIDGLTEMLTKNLSLGKLVDVSFKVYWLSPSQYQIVVQGLPKGFQEIRNDLTTLVKGKLEFVLPEKFSDKFKGYSLKSEPIANGKLIRAIDTSYTMMTSEVDIVIDKSGVLKTIESKTAPSNIKTEFFHSPKAWSNNKLVLDKVVLTSKQGPTQYTTSNELEYLNVNGIGFPSKITVKNVAFTYVPASGKQKEYKDEKKSSTVIRFTKYEVNTGKASKFINEGPKK